MTSPLIVWWITEDSLIRYRWQAFMPAGTVAEEAAADQFGGRRALISHGLRVRAGTLTSSSQTNQLMEER